MSGEATMQRSSAPCRWCESEQGIPARDVSYTICPDHFEEMRRQLDNEPIDDADRRAILACGQRYERIAYSASVLVGCTAAGVVLLAGVWFVQWMGWWPR